MNSMNTTEPVTAYQIWLANVPSVGDDSCVIRGLRPVVIVSNEKANRYSSVVSAVPLTTNMRSAYIPTHVVLNGFGLRCESVAKCDSIMPLDKSNLVYRIGEVTDENSKREIRQGLLIQLGFI